MNQGMKRVLVTGANGLLGQRLALLLGERSTYELLLTSHHPTSFLNHYPLLDYTQLDITCKSDVKSLATSFRPDVIINAAAMTNVDACESQRELAWKVNVHGVENLVDVSRTLDAKLIHISSDYVFDGLHGPYEEEDRPNPINYYGKTKLASENVIRMSDLRYAIIRTIVLYGTGKNVKQNFALWVIENLKERRPIKAATDQIGNPTYVDDLAFCILQVIEEGGEGVYHLSGSERLSRYEFARRICTVFGFDESLIVPVPSEEIRQAARRPLNTGFVTLKVQTELGLKPADVTQGLTMLRRQMHGTRARFPNSA
jgi:dTDP-4-dehydrorhamnose reductase